MISDDEITVVMESRKLTANSRNTSDDNVGDNNNNNNSYQYNNKVLYTIDNTTMKKSPIINSTIPFPWKVHEMVNFAEQESLSYILSWLPDNKSFKVHSPTGFVDILMSKFFKQTKYKSVSSSTNSSSPRSRRVSTQQHQLNCSNDTTPPGIPIFPDLYLSTSLFNGNNNSSGGGGGDGDTGPLSVTAFPPFMKIENCNKTIITSEVKPFVQQRYSPPHPTMKYYGNNNINSNSNSNSNTFIIDATIDDMLTKSYQQEDNNDDSGFFEGRHFFFLDEHVSSSFPKRSVNRVSLSS